MLQLVQDNLNNTPKTLVNLVWGKISNGINLNNNELEYLKKHKPKGIIEFGLIENGCWIVNSIGHKFWYKYGKLHREDGPAIELRNGGTSFYKNGSLHREDGPAINRAFGIKEYWVNGKLHREDGPAIEWANDNIEYWVNGLLHREDGPAIKRPNGDKEYWVNGKKVS